ncbi:MAG TPA: hypothetical protein VLJ16_03605, partial [Acidobacteriota bacterium]|nr:hypothetical protein [Acidobacteriota bacterium]
MNKKAVALLTAIAFLVPFEACLSVKKDVKTDPGSMAGAPPYKTTVVAVQTKAGERLAFPRGSRATIAGDRLLIPEGRTSGHYVMLRNRYPKESLRNVIKDRRGRIVEVTLSDGRVLKVRGEVQEDKDALVLSGLTYRSVPLADIDLVWIKKTDRMSSIVASTLMWGGGLTLVVLALTSGHERSPSPPPEESCPFVYSFDGTEYVLDAEPYGGSVCPGLERADWIGLDNLRPVGGLYRLRLSNELDEVEHIDELKLVVADHPVGVEVFPELSGRLRTAAAPLPPASARDADGRDILPLVGAKDQTFWLGRVEGRDPDRLEDLKEELVFEFVKPSGARQAKLIANAWTTRWGSQAIRPLLASQGRALGPYLEKVGRGGAPLLSLLGWFAREEMYNLQVRVETASGWTTKALVHGGGPMVAKDKVYPLDVSDVAGDKVRIKLTPAA